MSLLLQSHQDSLFCKDTPKYAEDVELSIKYASLIYHLPNQFRSLSVNYCFMHLYLDISKSVNMRFIFDIVRVFDKNGHEHFLVSHVFSSFLIIGELIGIRPNDSPVYAFERCITILGL